MREAPTWDLVLKRNTVERLKRERFPLDVMDDLPRLAALPYEDIAEEDVVRLQWHGLYHDKPKVGTFMLRVKVPGGVLSPAALRAIGEISLRSGRGSGELTTRQNVQLHWIRLEALPEVFGALQAVGLTTAGACGDTVRNITGCPVSGLDSGELFDAGPTIAEAARFFSGNREYSDLPRKHKITVSTCPAQCNAPELNCVALVGARKVEPEGGGGTRVGFAVRVGGGLASTPRLSRHLGVLVEISDAVPVLRAILDVWKSDTRYRLSRVKARLKFMIDDYGTDGFRELIEARLGRKLDRLPEPPAPAGTVTDHLGVHRQRQEGLYYMGFSVPGGLLGGEPMLRLADLAESYGGDVRLTRQQNFILTHVPEERLAAVMERVAAIGFPIDANRIRGRSVACTGEPFCNYSVTPTKSTLARILDHLERTFGRAVEDLRINLDGCPHACAHHWTGDIGIQGTTGRGAAGERIEAYDIILRGGLGAEAAIGRAVLRRVPAVEVEAKVESLVRAYLDSRLPGETFRGFCARHGDDELVAFASLGSDRARPADAAACAALG